MQDGDGGSDTNENGVSPPLPTNNLGMLAPRGGAVTSGKSESKAKQCITKNSKQNNNNLKPAVVHEHISIKWPLTISAKQRSPTLRQGSSSAKSQGGEVVKKGDSISQSEANLLYHGVSP